MRGRRRADILKSVVSDLLNLRASTVMMIGIIAFGGLVWYHSGKLFGPGSSSGKNRADASKSSVQNIHDEMIDMEKAMTAILQSHRGVSQAAELAKKEVQRQHAVREAYKASAIVVVTNKPSMNVHLAVRDISKLDFIQEVVVWHESSSGEKIEPWEEVPKEMHGKPVTYVYEPSARKEMAKYYACSQHTRSETNVCYFQVVQRDTSSYINSLWSSFLRAPELLHTAVAARTYFLDQELTFREDAFHINAGFAYMNGGSFFLKHHAKSFLDRARTAAAVPDGRAGLYESAADVFFSLGLNAPPAELANVIVPYKRQIDEPKILERNAYVRRSMQKEAHVLALKQLLEDALHTLPENAGPAAAAASAAGRAPGDDADDFVVKADPAIAPGAAGGRGADTGDHSRGREWRPDDVSSCHSDNCLLITNVAAVQHSAHMDAAQLGPRLRELLDRTVSTAECEVFKAHQYYFAVDNDMHTQWVSTGGNVTAGSYFGLDLLRLHKDLRNVTVTAGHPYQRDLIIEVSMTGEDYYSIVSIPKTERVDMWSGFEVVKYSYDLSDSLASAWQQILELPTEHHATTPTPPLYIRYIRFRAGREYRLPLIVFEFDYAVGDPFDGTAPTPSASSPTSTRARPAADPAAAARRGGLPAAATAGAA